MNSGKQRNMTSVFLTAEGKILLLYRQGSRVINNQWIGSAGGHFEQGELNDADACMMRELKEELSISEKQLRNPSLRYVTLRYIRDELWINYFYFAELPDGPEMDLHSAEGILEWFPLDEILSLEIPATTKMVLEHYLAEGRYSTCLYAGASDGSKTEFTVLKK